MTEPKRTDMFREHSRTLAQTVVLSRGGRFGVVGSGRGIFLPVGGRFLVAVALSRGGDRQLNRALHTIVLHRRAHDPATKAYIARRVSEGKSRRDATRLLKRYLARHLYRLLETQTPLTT